MKFILKLVGYWSNLRKGEGIYFIFGKWMRSKVDLDFLRKGVRIDLV